MGNAVERQDARGKGHHLCHCSTQNLPGGVEENCNGTCHDSDL